jgi:hypothetical protein
MNLCFRLISMSLLKTVNKILILDSLFYYQNYEQMLNNQIELNNSPVVCFVFNHSFIFGEGKMIYEFFLKNSFESDALILLSKNLSTFSEPSKIKKFSFDIDHRLTPEQFNNNFLKLIKPDCEIFHFDGNLNHYLGDKFVNTKYQLNKTFSIKFEELRYSNAYIISNKDFKLLNSEESFLLDIVKENDTIFFNINEKVVNAKKTEHDRFEEDLDKMLALNDMKINELYIKGEIIEIRINKITNNKLFEVIINNSEGDDSNISINCDNSEDSAFLNNLIINLFK